MPHTRQDLCPTCSSNCRSRCTHGDSQNAAIESNHGSSLIKPKYIRERQCPPTYQIGLHSNNVTCNRTCHIGVNSIDGQWRVDRVARGGAGAMGENGAYHTGRGAHLGRQRGRLPSRTPDKTTNTLMRRLTLAQGSAPEDGGRRCRQLTSMTSSARRR
jgi:hypothetical protein